MKAALKRIANHFEGCDIRFYPDSNVEDKSSIIVLLTACRALGWEIEYDQDHQVVLNKSKETLRTS